MRAVSGTGRAKSNPVLGIEYREVAVSESFGDGGKVKKCVFIINSSQQAHHTNGQCVIDPCFVELIVR